MFDIPEDLIAEEAGSAVSKDEVLVVRRRGVSSRTQL
jgi:hypothetical protein